jgi:hypothetical protein
MKNLNNQIDENHADTLQALLELNLKVVGMQIDSNISTNGRKKSLVQGVGINDADYPIDTVVNGVRTTCPLYKRWASMLERCYSAKRNERVSTYRDCSVADEWLTFSNFKNWMELQDWDGKQLDKDILVAGNKVYSPETCVFVDGKTNTFLIDSAASRGKYGIGVEKIRNKYRAHCSKNGKKVSIGIYDTPLAASKAYFKYKLTLAYELAKQQSDERVAVAILSRFISSRRANIHVKSN